MKTPFLYFLFYLIIMVSPSLLFAQDILEQKVNLKVEKLALAEILEKLETNYKINFAFNNQVIPLDKPFSANAEDIPLKQCLSSLFEKTNIQFELIKDQLVLYRTSIPKFTIKGYLSEAHSGEALINANVYDEATMKGSYTNEFGFFSITLPEGKYTIVSSYTGYQERRDTVLLFENISMYLNLKSGNDLEIVEVVGERVKVEDVLPVGKSINESIQTIVSTDKMEKLPTLLGVRDPVNIFQLEAGIHTSDESSNGLHVRGGSPGQNLMLLDGVPVYNADHLFGFFSTFNGDAIKYAKIYKGGFPARYGGRISSVLDIRMKDGNNQKIHGNVSMGFLTGGLLLEGPLIKNKTSFVITARRTWLDFLISALIQSSDDDINFRYSFYDVNAKINHTFNNKNKLFISVYAGDDELSFDQTYNTSVGGVDIEPYLERSLLWGNKVVSIRWNQDFGQFFNNTSLTFSNYNYQTGEYYLSDSTKIKEDLEIYDFESVTRINDFGLRSDFDYHPYPEHHVRFGAGYVFHGYKPIAIKRFQSIGGIASSRNNIADVLSAQEAYIYAEDEYQVNDKLLIHPGLHIASLFIDEQVDLSVQPRLSITYNLTKKQTFSLSYSRMNQYIHAINNPSIGLPTDVWVPSTQKVAPELGDIISFDYRWKLNDRYSLELGAYAKWMYDILQLKDGQAYFIDGRNWEEEVVSGDGRSFGGEFSFKKKKGNLTGIVSYTYAKSDRTFPKINNGKKFPYRFEREHDISIALSQKISKRVNLGVIWTYGSGAWITLYNQAYATTPNLNGELSNAEFGYVLEFGDRNTARLPAYHRLDLALNFVKQKRWGERTWSLGLYNAYGRKNPYDVNVNYGSNINVQYNLQYLISFPLPYVSFNFKF